MKRILARIFADIFAAEKVWLVRLHGVILCCLIATTPACSDRQVETGSGDEARAVQRTVERFGARLKGVSLLAPDEIVTPQIREEYGPLVSSELVRSWIENTSEAPGRTVSSPWPERIDILDVRRVNEDLFTVRGEVVYLTSVEVAEGGAAAREPVILRVGRGDDGRWRIHEYAVLDRG